jgi:membrane-associated protease RseP (regulator of RpoE activity)
MVAITVALTQGALAALLAGGLAVAALVSTALLHEGGHAAAAALCGVRLHTLTLRGAVAATVRRDRVRPGPAAARTEALICLAGPAASLVALGVAAALLLLDVRGPGRAAAWCLLAANLVAIAGSLPGIPSSDGSRALRAWRDRRTP